MEFTIQHSTGKSSLKNSTTCIESAGDAVAVFVNKMNVSLNLYDTKSLFVKHEAVKKSKKLLKFVLDDGTGTDRVILSGIHEYYEPEELVGKTCVAITNLPPRPMMGIASEGMLISAVHHEEGAEKLHLLMLDPHIPAGAKLY